MKKNCLKKLLAGSLSLAMLVGLIPAAAGTAPAANLVDQISSANVVEAVDPEEWVTVIVEMDGSTTLDVEEYVTMFQNDSKGYSADATVAAYRADLVSQQNELQLQINAINSESEFKYHYTNLLNGFAAHVQYKDIETIKSLDGVYDVYMTQSYTYDDSWEAAEDGLSALSDTGSVNQMGLQTAWDAGYTGAGKIVGVFDSSLRYTHDMFQYMDPAVKAAGENGELSNYMTQERLKEVVTANKDSLNLFVSDWGCWFHGWAEEGNDHATGFSEEMQEQFLAGVYGTDGRNKDKVPFAVDYCCGDMDVWDGDSSSHGTHVSGIAAGNAGPDNVITTTNKVLGGAYDAQIMFFKVFCEDDDFGQECDECVFAALDDAVTLGVNSFNLSLGIPNGFTTMSTYAQGGYMRAYSRATAAGISVCVSAGNDARDSHGGALINGYTTLLPNSSKVGFSGCTYGPMTIASAQGTGYISVVNTTVATVTIDEAPVTYTVTDNNAKMVGNVLTGVYTTADMVPVGLGSVEEILAATGAESIEGALAGKIALVQRGTLNYVDKGKNVAAAGAIGMIMGNSSNSVSNLSASNIYAGLPTFGCIPANAYTSLVDAVKAGKTITISFASSTTARQNNYLDSGPSSFTSWGVTEAMDLKPDIMAPGGSIYSTGAASDTALSAKSGTSMASPNSEGAFILIQQYVDDNLDVFGVEPGTIEYNCLINQLAASTAVPYMDNTGRYFSPRRQGSGMINVANAMNSRVVLSNDVVYEAETGNAPRAKVNLGDKVGDTFDITFNVTNYNKYPVIFDVTAALQTDSTTTTNGRDIIKVQSGATPGDALPGVMTVSNVTEGAVILTDSADINSYTEGTKPTTMVVNTGAQVKVTVTVTLDSEAMAAYDAKFPNGMFVEGFVMLNGVNGTQTVGLPFMGFRGDFTDAPIFDLQDAYTDITDKATTDLDYPLYHTDMLNSYVDNKIVVTGANQFTGAEMPEYFVTSSTARTRSYLDTLRAAGNLSADYAAISPNGDGNMDSVFAALYLLRNAKVLVVTITDAEGNVVKTMKPEYEFFESLTSDGNQTQQVSLTDGTKYNRNMAWDGTDAEGKVVADGQYYYNVYGLTEYEYLNNCGFNAADADVVNYVLGDASNAQSVSFAVKVDTAAPVVSATLEGSILTVKASDDTAIQAIAVYSNGVQVGQTTLVNADSCDATIDLSDAEFDAAALEVQVCDYAMNVTKAAAEVIELAITAQPVDYAGPVGTTATFTVETNSDAATYQWMYSNNGWSWAKSSMAGNNTNSLTVKMTAARVGQQYKCVVTGADGTVIESEVVTLKVASDIVIVSNPVNFSGKVNDKAVFTVEATGDGLSYQWMYSNNGGATWSKSGAIGNATASLTIEARAFRNGQMYKCVITDVNGGVAESTAATMNVG